MYTLKITLDFKEDQWIANLGGEEVSFRNFDDLKEILVDYFQNKGLQGEVRVKISYDWRKLPQWLWQYQSYYFERILELKL